TKLYQREALVYLTSILLFAVLTVVSAAQEKKKAPNHAVAATFIDCTLVPGNLVANCGFETGDFTNWTQGGDLSDTRVSSEGAHSGSFGAHLGPTHHLGLLTQLVMGTTPSISCSLSIWLRSN